MRPPSAHCVRPAGQLQVPSVHDAPSGQRVPHEPQLAALVSVSTHADTIMPPRPPKPKVHIVSPPSPQPAAHIPPEHVVPIPHRAPQRPQLALFEVGSTHVVPQRISDDEH
jgi:hypothetical protein